MAFKYDFPHPPFHYKSMTSENCHNSPDLNLFFNKVKTIHVFSQPENVQDSSIRFMPNYLANIKNVVIPNKGFKTDLMFLVERLEQEFIEYIKAMQSDPYSLLQRSTKITELITQVFYVIKVAKNTTQSAVQLNDVFKLEIMENKKLVAEYTDLIHEMSIQLNELLN